MEQKGKERVNSLSLFELSHPSSPAFGHQTSALLGLGLLDSDWDLNHQPPASQSFRLRRNYTTDFPGL